MHSASRPHPLADSAASVRRSLQVVRKLSVDHEQDREARDSAASERTRQEVL